MANREVIVKNIDVRTLKNLFGEGKFASVQFVKKSDNTLRTAVGKTSVRRALRGGDAAYDAESFGQVRVFDVNKRDAQNNRVGGWISVTAKNLKWVQSKGVKYVVKPS